VKLEVSSDSNWRVNYYNHFPEAERMFDPERVQEGPPEFDLR
jgi:hypothetical protein